MEQLKTYPTIGVCGLDCGLCPRYYTQGTSRCPGCGGPGFSAKHPSCSFITCCVKKKGLEVCGQCDEFPCPKFTTDEQYRRMPQSSSYPPCSKMLPNLRCVKDQGVKGFVRRQQKRIALLEAMIEGYDDGRSRSFFCRAAALLEPATVKRSLARAKKTSSPTDRTRILRDLLVQAARRDAIEL